VAAAKAAGAAEGDLRAARAEMTALVLRQSLKRALKEQNGQQQRKEGEEGDESEADKDKDGEEAAEAAAIMQLALQSLWTPGGGFSHSYNNDDGNSIGGSKGQAGESDEDLRTQLQHLHVQVQVLTAERDEATKACSRSEVSTQRLLKGAAATRKFFTQKVCVRARVPCSRVWFGMSLCHARVCGLG